MKRPYCVFLALATLILQADLTFSDVRMSAIIGSNMVLQQDIPIQIWGWAEPGESVTVQLKNNEARTKADK